MNINIEDYVCNLAAGNKYISSLYNSIDRAIDIQNRDNKFQRFNVRITFPDIGSRVYKSEELVRLENLSYCLSYNNIIHQINDGVPTLDQYIILLIKGRNTIRGFYQAYARAGFALDNTQLFCYTFIMPYGPQLVSVNSKKFSLNGARHFRDFFCKCERNIFNSQMVFNNLYSF